MKYLGIDYGTKKIGLSISDSTGTTAVGYSLIETNQETLAKILKIVQEENIEGFVIGYSISGSGEVNQVQKHIDTFTKIIKDKTGLPVFTISEMYSSMQAKWGVTKDIRRVIKSDRVQSKVKAPKTIDRGAAVILLQSYLDSQNNRV